MTSCRYLISYHEQEFHAPKTERYCQFFLLFLIDFHLVHIMYLILICILWYFFKNFFSFYDKMVSFPGKWRICTYYLHKVCYKIWSLVESESTWYPRDHLTCMSCVINVHCRDCWWQHRPLITHTHLRKTQRKCEAVRRRHFPPPIRQSSRNTWYKLIF